MNQNYVNLKSIFLREESKNIHLKVTSMFLFVALQFLMAEIDYIRKNNLLVAMWLRFRENFK